MRQWTQGAGCLPRSLTSGLIPDSDTSDQPTLIQQHSVLLLLAMRRYPVCARRGEPVAPITASREKKRSCGATSRESRSWSVLPVEVMRHGLIGSEAALTRHAADPPGVSTARRGASSVTVGALVSRSGFTVPFSIPMARNCDTRCRFLTHT